MNENRWIMSRAGLVNFWYYDEEEFEFSEGRMLLRGSNGSGKSVTMQSFIPLLLDGNKSPERLDPFGSKARKIDNYILGDEDSGKDESIGYLYLEFKKEDTENYLTIGMGFKAARGKTPQSWGFAIKDGRRIGKDFKLYKEVGERLPLSKKELENRIGLGGHVCDSQNEYMRLVNESLFGFDDIEEYDELIKLLVQLRSPKLSKDFKPTVIYEIMSNSLQQLSEEDLRPMSEAIENMDNIKGRLEELKESKKAGEKIKTAFDKYNSFMLYDKTKDFIECNAELEKFKRQKEALLVDSKSAEQGFMDAEKRLIELDIEKKRVEDKKRELDKHESLNIKEQIAEIEKTIKELKTVNLDKEKQHNDKTTKKIEINNALRKAEDDRELQLKKIGEKLAEMADTAEDFAFDEHFFMNDELSKNIDKEYNFGYIETNLNGVIKKLQEAKEALIEEDRKNKEYDKALYEFEKSKENKEQLDRKLEETRRLLLETKEEYIEKLYSWKKSNKELVLTDGCLVETSRLVNNFDDNSNFEQVIANIRKEYNNSYEAISTEIGSAAAANSSLKNELHEKELILKEWIEKKDPEPERNEKVILNRERLKKEGIPFTPFYKAIDFKEDMAEDLKVRIEEAFIDMGILDALIISKSFKEAVLNMDANMADKYLFSSPKVLVYDLTEHLKIDVSDSEGIAELEIDEVLRSILSDESSDSPYVNQNGEYGLGILRGKVTSNYVPKFIGSAARKRFKEETIKNIKSECDEIQIKINNGEELLKSLRNRLNELKIEFENIPDNSDLFTALSEVKDANFKYEKSIEEMQKKQSEERKLYEELKKIKEKVHELTYKIQLKPEKDIYEEAVEEAGNYKDSLYKLKDMHKSLIHIIEKIKIKSDELETVEQDIDNILYDMNANDRRIKENAAKLNTFTEMLKLSDYEQIKNEIDECIRLMAEIPSSITAEARKSERLKSELEQIKNKIEVMDRDMQMKEKLNYIYAESFKDEYSLGYIIPVNEEEDILKAAKSVMKELKTEEKTYRSKDEYINTIYTKFNENNQYLREYMIKIETIFDNNEEGTNFIEITNALSKRRRLNLTGKVRGRDVNFYDLISFIEEGVEENEKLLKESDRQLFEDILVKNISKKIRAKIYHSQKWVDKMNDLMKSMDTSSGLSFSLDWINKRGETEEQMDTRELVELLKLEGGLMKEKDLNKLSEHFRSKITEARRVSEDSGNMQTFHSIIREVLDYRKWFEFKLNYVKTGQKRKELTNNAFFQFSGGEKAMAMYVPLFSAVYARYEGASKDCPRMISLDEAFAGVDEKNIRDMFRLLNELKLNYIINSQVLWGDYDTVPSLSICELIRPDNASFVTVIRYRWNGTVKELITN